MSYLSHRSFAIPALENHVTFFLLPNGSPAQPARKYAGKIAPVLSSKSRMTARTAASLDVIFPLRSPHGSQHGSRQAIPQGYLHRGQRAQISPRAAWRKKRLYRFKRAQDARVSLAFVYPSLPSPT